MTANDRCSVEANAAKVQFAELLAQVEAGHEVTITRQGVPVARFVPIKRPSTADERRAAIDAIRRLGSGLSLGGLKIRELVDEGRR
jgi:prevent-host-death family protein